MLTAATSAQTLTFTYDALGRNLTQVGPLGTATSAYDAASRRTQLTYPGTGLYVNYDYDVAGDLTKIRENGASSGVGVLATWAYDNLGRRTTLTRGNGTTTSYGYDAVSRLDSLAQNLSGSNNDLTLGFDYNPASQITSTTRSNDAYAYGGFANGNTASTVNGLNQLTAIGGQSVTHDSRGNVSAIGPASYGYSSENLLTSGPGSVTLTYDPGNRLYQTAGTSTTRFAYDGVDMIGEYDGSDALQRRYVFDPVSGAPLVWYEGAGTSDRRFIHTDERGSVVATSNSAGAMLSTDSYDEYGIPASTNTGRFGYTGQAYVPELGLWYYRNRMYNPNTDDGGAGGRFMQFDPIGLAGGMNGYNYVGGNPVNFTDPLGLQCVAQNWSMHIYDAQGHDLGPDPVEPESGVIFYGDCSNGDSGGGDGDNQNILVTGRRIRGPQIFLIARIYSGRTFCQGATIGSDNPRFPQGRVNTGKRGDAQTALNDIDEIAATNGISTLESVLGDFRRFENSMRSPISIPVGGGWFLHTDVRSGQRNISNGGLTLRFDALGDIRVDIPAGFKLPSGGALSVNESCHYHWR